MESSRAVSVLSKNQNGNNDSRSSSRSISSKSSSPMATNANMNINTIRNMNATRHAKESHTVVRRGSRHNNNGETRATPPSPTSTRASQPPASPLSSQAAGTVVDFIGPMKDLFAFPYSPDKGISVAVHNLGGTLLVDVDTTMADQDAAGYARLYRHGPTNRRRSKPTGGFHVTAAGVNMDMDAASSNVQPHLRRRDNIDETSHIQQHAHQENFHSVAPEGTTIVTTGSQLMALPDSETEKPIDPPPRDALALVTSMLQHQSIVVPSITKSATSSPADASSTSAIIPPLRNQSLLLDHHHQQQQHITATKKEEEDTTTTVDLPFPPAEYYAGPIVPQQSREYVRWKFRDMNLLVESDAIVYRDNVNATNNDDGDGANDSNKQQQAVAVRVADASDLRSQLLQHQQMVGQGQFVLDYGMTFNQQIMGHKRSYAEAALTPCEQAATAAAAPGKMTRKADKDSSSSVAQLKQSPNRNTNCQNLSSYPAAASSDLDQVRLQTCMVPSAGAAGSALGGILSPVGPHHHCHPSTTRATPANNSTESSSPPSSTPPGVDLPPPPSALSTVVDAYLDNIMANIPQLALCLYEKGLIQSVKLLPTEDIPYAFMHPSTLDTTTASSFDAATASTATGRNSNSNSNINNNASCTGTGDVTEPLFTPQIMEMNASMILRFLKANCTRDNSTYLLRREAGQTNIQLYDISSISTQRQRKWIWWLATMSYRFALRLEQLSSTHAIDDRAMKRNFRARQRSLLQNALDMLEDLQDMDDGRAHETLRAAVCENLADTFLTSSSGSTGTSTSPEGENMHTNCDHLDDPSGGSSGGKDDNTKPAPSTSSSQPYGGISVDALNKAHDHLTRGIRTLWPIFERARRKEIKERERQHRHRKKKTRALSSTNTHRRVVVTHNDGSSSSSNSDSDDNGYDDSDSTTTTAPSIEMEATTMQMFGLHHKVINVSLRQAEHHLHNYFSSSAMQSLRTAARQIAAAISLLEPLKKQYGTGSGPGNDIRRLRQSLRYQYTWLWEHCGHFARSFAADSLWRDRGHTCGDDIISLLRDVEAAFTDDQAKEECRHTLPHPLLLQITALEAPLSKKTNNMVSLRSLSAVVIHHNDANSYLGNNSKGMHTKYATPAIISPKAAAITRAELDTQKQIKRDERRVLVAACVAYSRAIGTFQEILSEKQAKKKVVESNDTPPVKATKSVRIPEPLQEQASSADSTILALLQKRIGDACNEIGKIFLNELRTLFTDSSPNESKTEGNTSLAAAAPLLSSAQFWFTEGLRDFEECKDLRNVALIQCNLCQCCKLQANNIFVSDEKASQESPSSGGHAENCLQDAATHLQMAHETLGQRDVDPVTWDMVSEELAATFLVLGVRRRQSLLGGGSTPLLLQALRLTPGKEKSIIDPMEKALKIYDQSGNAHQAAAAHYQLALFFSKVWTCQRDESKTREKLSDAFSHYSAAHKYFSRAPPGNEATFVILCLDLSNLYSAVVAGDKKEECLTKALHRCLEASDAFSPVAIHVAHERHRVKRSDWFQKMSTLATSVEDRVFKLLMSLVNLRKKELGA